MNDFLEKMDFPTLTSDEVRMISPLKLAYLGDAVYEMYVRIYVVNKCKKSVNDLNRESVRLVKAGAQANAVKEMNELGLLTEQEWATVKKGRNQKSHTSAKNASLADYKYATGFESMIGYLSITEQKERLEEVIGIAIKLINGEYHD